LDPGPYIQTRQTNAASDATAVLVPVMSTATIMVRLPSSLDGFTFSATIGVAATLLIVAVSAGGVP
jgi:hypothetical protein